MKLWLILTIILCIVMVATSITIYVCFKPKPLVNPNSPKEEGEEKKEGEQKSLPDPHFVNPFAIMIQQPIVVPKTHPTFSTYLLIHSSRSNVQVLFYIFNHDTNEKLWQTESPQILASPQTQVHLQTSLDDTQLPDRIRIEMMNYPSKSETSTQSLGSLVLHIQEPTPPPLPPLINLTSFDYETIECLLTGPLFFDQLNASILFGIPQKYYSSSHVGRLSLWGQKENDNKRMILFAQSKQPIQIQPRPMQLISCSITAEGKKEYLTATSPFCWSLVFEIYSSDGTVLIDQFEKFHIPIAPPL